MDKKININIFRSLLAVLILFIPLYPKFPLANVSGTYVAVRLDDIIIFIVVVIWCIYQVAKKFPVLKLKPTKLFLLYFLAISASSLTAILIYQTDPKNILLLNLLRRFEYMSLFFVTIDAIKKVSDLKFPYYFLLISTLFVSIYGFGQKYLSFPIVSTMNSEFSKGQLLQMNVWTRVSSTFAGHYDLAVYMSVVLIIILAVTTLIKNKLLKILGLIVWIPSFYILTLTASRVSVFAYWGGAIATLILIRKYLWIIPVSLLFFVSISNSSDLSQRLLATIPALKNQFFAPAPTAIPTVTAALPTPSKRVIPTPTKFIIRPTPIPTVIRHPGPETIPVDTDAGVARSGEIRFNVEWPRAITAFNKNTITGTGMGSITLATDNDYLRLLGESGLLGFTSFMTILIYFVLRTLPIPFKKTLTLPDYLSLIFFGCLVTVLANATFIDVFEASKPAYLFWIMMGVYYCALEFAND